MTSRSSRRNRRLERPRERVVVEAWDLLVERGLADLSLAELGRRLDTSAGHLTYYFGSKDGLLLEVIRWSEEELRREREVILVEPIPVLERLRRYCDLYLPRAAGDPRWLIWAELWPRVTREPALKEAQVTYGRAWREDLETLLREEYGETVDPARVGRSIIAALDGFGLGLLTGERSLTPDTVWEHVRDLLPDAPPPSRTSTD